MTSSGHRYHPRAIEGDDANDGYVLTTVGGKAMWMPPPTLVETLPATIIDAKGDVIVGTAADTAARLAVGSDGQVLTADAASAGGIKWATPASGGGGGGTTINDRRWVPGATETTIDEFQGSALAASWTHVDLAGTESRVTWIEDGDVLAFLNTGGDAAAQLHAVMQPLSSFGGSVAAGDAFLTAAALPAAANGNSFSGVIVADGTTYGSGNQMLVTRHQTGQLVIRRFTGYNANPAFTTGPTLTASTLFFRLVYVSGSNWRLDYSSEGVAWGQSSTLAAVAGFTPTHVGLISSSWGGTAGTANCVASYHFLRRMPT